MQQGSSTDTPDYVSLFNKPLTRDRLQPCDHRPASRLSHSTETDHRESRTKPTRAVPLLQTRGRRPQHDQAHTASIHTLNSSETIELLLLLLPPSYPGPLAAPGHHPAHKLLDTRYVHSIRIFRPPPRIRKRRPRSNPVRHPHFRADQAESFAAMRCCHQVFCREPSATYLSARNIVRQSRQCISRA